MVIQCFVFFNSGPPQAQETCYLNVLYFVGDMALFWGYVERSQHRTIMTGSRHEEEVVVVWARGLQSGLQCNCRVHKADKQLISYMRFSAKTLAVMGWCVRSDFLYNPVDSGVSEDIQYTKRHTHASFSMFLTVPAADWLWQVKLFP